MPDQADFQAAGNLIHDFNIRPLQPASASIDLGIGAREHPPICQMAGNADCGVEVSLVEELAQLEPADIVSSSHKSR